MNLTQQLGYQVNFSGRFGSTAGLIFNRFNHLQTNQVSCFTWLKELNRRVLTSIRILISHVQMKFWAGKALETVNCCAFLKRRLIGAC
jgi:hypothetical protein